MLKINVLLAIIIKTCHLINVLYKKKCFQVLVEYDDVEWQRREWINVYKDGVFHMFLIEQGLFWTERIDPYSTAQTKVLWPALVSTNLFIFACACTVTMNFYNQYFVHF